MSFAQERLWFLEQWEPGRSVYNLCRAVRIAGILNIPVLQRSVNAILARHETLRSKFLSVDGRAVQVVAQAEALSIAPVDLRPLGKAARRSETARLIHEAAKEPFDLTRGRLLRVQLLRQSDDEHVLVVSTHHLVSDAWSMGIFFRELWSLYGGFAGEDALSLPALSIQYGEYAMRQRQRLRGDVLDLALAYWRTQLADLPALDLPTDYPRPPRQSFLGDRQAIELPAALTAALKGLSRREGVTPFMTLLAAFQLLLHRYSGQKDIAVGSPVANRDRTDVEGVIGLFVNTLVLRADLTAAPTFKLFLARVREVCLDAYAHQEIPFEKLVEELNPRRELNRNPLFQAMFVLQNTPSLSLKPAGLTLTPVQIDNPTAQFDLSLYLRERAGRLTGFIEYATDLFACATMERMAGHFQALLEGITANPKQSISDLPLLAGAERRQLLVEWNDTAADYPRDAIHELFEAQVERTPDAAALEYEGGRLTYRELNRRANRLARHLKELGAGPEILVGVLVERSLEMVASLLAVLKAGGAYVPLDPAYPKERLAFMLADARVGIVLSQKKCASLIAEYPGTVLCLDELPLKNVGNDANLDHETAPDHAAYLIYTSGSTGRPKGVVGLHRGAINRFAWMWKTYPFRPGEKSCQKTSLSFVDSVWEVFGALLQGISTVIVPDATVKEPQLLVRLLAERKVTRLVVVPSLLKAILDQCPNLTEQLSCLKFCISSGEALSVELAKRFRKTLPGCRLINLYGSSELAGDVTCYETRDGDIGIPIGRPIQNTQIYLLDCRMQPVPIGVPGELYVGGDNLARGYLHRPEWTAEKFIANPFSGKKKSRLYRTGDLARSRADGNIEFLGRVDNQVKIHGCRIELSEIEATLLQHPVVKECAVIAINGMRSEAPPSVPLRLRSGQASPVKGEEVSESDRQLVAYIVPNAEEPLAAELRHFLQEKLPDFMVPSVLIFLSALPLLPNGKVDRRALPPAREHGFAADRIRTEARTEIEALVAQVWRDALNMDLLGVDDHFFDLGGHSLLAAQVAAKLHAASGREVLVRDLFEAPTVAGLAGMIEKSIRAENKAELPPITATPRKRFMPLSPSQERLFSFAQLFGGGDFLNMPYAYRLNGRLDAPVLRAVLREMVRRHEALRTGFIETDDGPRQFVRGSAGVKLPLFDLSRLAPNERDERLDELSRNDAAQCFDLERPPLIRVKLLRLAAERHVLLVTMHHLVTDQWSMGVFRRELAALYQAFSQGLPSPLADLPVQFSDFSAWQRRILSNGLLSRQISYWRDELGERPAHIDFHCGARGKNGARFHSLRRPIEIDDGLFKKVKNFAGEVTCTPFMIFVAALKILIYRCSGQEDVRIGTLIANRGQPGTEGLIGYFTNALVLRTRVEPNLDGRDFLRKVRDVCLSAYANPDVPFEHLEGALEENRRRRAAPIYQVMLHYRSLLTAPATANGLTITSWDGKNRAADPGIDISRLDVNFHLRELSTKLTGAVNYRTDLFDEPGMDKFLRRYSGIVKQLILYPDRRISNIKLD